MAHNIKTLETCRLIKIECGKVHRSRIVSVIKLEREKLEEAYPCGEKAQNEIIVIVGHDEWRSMTSRM